MILCVLSFLTRKVTGILAFHLIPLVSPLFFASNSYSDSAPTKSKIGIIAPLTGVIAEYGVAIANGARLAAEDLNGAVEIRFEDNQYQTKFGISAYEKLKLEGVQIIYQWGSLPSEAVSNLAERDHIPLVVWTGDPKSIAGRAFTINAVQGPEVFIEPVLAKLRENKRSKIALVSNETPYTMGLRAALKAKLAPTEKIVFDEGTDHGTQDYKAITLRLKNTTFDTLGLLLLEPDLSIWCKSMNQAGINTEVFGSDQFESATSIKRCRPALDNGFFANHTQSNEFSNRYKEKFGNDIQLPDASLGYAMVEIFNYALTKDGPSPSAADIIKTLSALTDFETVKGITSVSVTDGVKHFTWPIVLRKTLP